jgi:tetratricopeptide (TPR) repeat protein
MQRSALVQGLVLRDRLNAFNERILGILLPLSCVVVPLVYAPVFSDYMMAKRAVLYFVIGLIIGIWLLRGALAGRVSLPTQVWFWPACAYMFAGLLSLTQASNLQQGIESLFMQGGLFAIALATADHYRGRIPWMLLASIIGTALLVSIIGVLQFADIHLVPMPHARFGNLGISTLGNTNFVAHYLEISILLTLGTMLSCRLAWQRGLLAVALLFTSYYMLLTQSRGGWLALMCGVVFFCWRMGRSLVRRIPWSVVVVAGLLMAVGAEFGLRATTGQDGNENPYGGLWGFVERVGARIASAADMQHISVAQRRLIWADTIELIKDEPLLGVGVGNYEFALPAYRTASRHREWQQYIGILPHMPYYAHNEYLELWAESGIGGVLAWVFMLAAIVWSGWRVAVAREEVEGRSVAWALLAVIVAVLVHAAFSLNWQDPVSALHFWIIVGVLGALRGTTARVLPLAPWGRVLAGAVAFVVVLGGSCLGLSIAVGDYYYFQGQKRYYDYSQPNRAFLSFDQAVAWRPTEFRHQHMLGLVALEIGQMDRAEVALSECVRLHPNNAAALRLVGQVLYWRDKVAAGVVYLRRAIALDPLHADAYAWLSRSLQQLGRSGAGTEPEAYAEAVETWQQALAFAPENAQYLRGLGLAYSETGKLYEAVEILERAIRLHPNDGIALGNLGAIYLRQNRVDKAEDMLKRATVAEPQRAEWWGNLGLLYTERGDLDKAEQAMRQAALRGAADLRWHLHLIEILLRRQRAEQAVEAALIALQHHPQNETLTKLVQDILHRARKGE